RAQHYVLPQRKQQEGEGIVEYSTALKKQALQWKSGSVEKLENRLTDVLIQEVRCSNLRKNLFKTADLTWQKALETAEADALVSKECKTMGKSDKLKISAIWKIAQYKKLILV